MRKTYGSIVLLGGVSILALLVWGVEQAAVAPLETGDVYPPFSSLRADPLGSKALYESLAALPGVDVDRLYKQRTMIGGQETMLVLGVEPVPWSAIQNRTAEEYEKLVANGGRLVIGFLPVRTPRRIPEKREVEQRWNLKLQYEDRKEEDNGAMPRETALFFEAGPEWRETGARAIERSFGKGTIVLAADTFALSNEGLREARDARFIAALLGGSTHIVFDENHFGVVDSGSVTKLMRKYHLEGAVAVLAVAAILFLWRSASSFLPPREAAADEAVAGRDSLEGMAALLRRGVAEKDLLDACFTAWNSGSPRRASRVEEELRRHKHDPVAAYR